MLNKLRIKFTLICWVITSLLLTVILICAYLLTRSQMQSHYLLSLTTELNTIKSQLQTSEFIHSSWLSELECDNKMIIHIEENDTPLLFKGCYLTGNMRTYLIVTAKQLLSDDTTLSSPSSLCFIKDRNGQRYLVNTLSFNQEKSCFYILLIKNLNDMDHQLSSLLYRFIFLAIICIILLILFSYWFAGKVIAPIAENDKKQRHFIAAASHELRSPLAVLRSSASALQTKIPSEDTHFLTAIDSECIRLTRLVSDLLLLTNADANNHCSLNLAPTEADTLLLELYDLFYSEATSNKHPLQIILPAEPVPSCLLDAERIKQILTIFIDNAIAYTPINCPILLSLTLLPHKLCFKVIDHGPGIPDAYKKQIFDRFYRIDRSRHDKNHFGLGLSIAHELTALHHGQLLLEDTPMGGCTFSLILDAINAPMKP